MFPSLPDRPVISVVIPAHNEGEWLERTVRAILAQTDGFALDVLVVDDGSRDGSTAFLARDWTGVRRVGQPGLGTPGAGTPGVIEAGGLGSAKARNLGAAQAVGEVLVFVDAHVLPDPGWLTALVGLLRQPQVGLAGLAVRDVTHPELVGYTYVFTNENLDPAWLPALSAGPYETPCLIGCCLAARRDVFQALGGFHPLHVRWGVEDIELSLRTWYLGWRCLLDPRAQVAHLFKGGRPRNFEVGFEEYDVNLLHTLLLYFSGPRQQTLLSALIRKRSTFARTLAQVQAEPAFWKYRQALQKRFQRSETWYFDRFQMELARFEANLKTLEAESAAAAQAQDHPGSVEAKGMKTSRVRRSTCPRCGAVNIGFQTTCLRCHSALPFEAAQPARPSVQPEPQPLPPVRPAQAAGAAPARPAVMPAPVERAVPQPEVLKPSRATQQTLVDQPAKPAGPVPQQPPTALAALALVSVRGIQPPVRYLIPFGVALRIGKSSGNNIVLKDPTVSRSHAQILLTAKGCELTDLGSTNGTQVNQKFIKRPTLLRLNDMITIGNVDLRLEVG